MGQIFCIGLYIGQDIIFDEQLCCVKSKIFPTEEVTEIESSGGLAMFRPFLGTALIDTS